MSDSEEEERAWAVIDNGSSRIRAGFSGDEAPRVDFAQIVGYTLGGVANGADKDYYIGEERAEKLGILMHRRPIDHAVNSTDPDPLITDWDDMEKIWRHTFDNELRIVVGDDEYPEDEDVLGVLLTEPPGNSKDNRERATEIMFEFGSRRFYLESTPLLALLASGRKTGMVLESGEQSLRAVPIYDCCVQSAAIERENRSGGRELLEWLCRSGLSEQCLAGMERFLGNTRSRWAYLNSEIKDRMCYVSLNFEDEVNDFEQQSFALPDDTKIALGNELIECPEVLFSPGRYGKDTTPIHQLVARAVGKHGFDESVKEELFGNVILAGGNTMFPNLGERLQAELEHETQKQEYGGGQHRVSVIAPPERRISSWIGGSILASLSVFEGMHIHKDAFHEVGARIVHQMCHRRALSNALNAAADDEEEET